MLRTTILSARNKDEMTYVDVFLCFLRKKKKQALLFFRIEERKKVDYRKAINDKNRFNGNLNGAYKLITLI